MNKICTWQSKLLSHILASRAGESSHVPRPRPTHPTSRFCIREIVMGDHNLRAKAYAGRPVAAGRSLLQFEIE